MEGGNLYLECGCECAVDLMYGDVYFTLTLSGRYFWLEGEDCSLCRCNRFEVWDWQLSESSVCSGIRIVGT